MSDAGLGFREEPLYKGTLGTEDFGFAFIGFVLSIARAAPSFLYLETMNAG